jgi:hypothetical protein
MATTNGRRSTLVSPLLLIHLSLAVNASIEMMVLLSCTAQRLA